MSDDEPTEDEVRRYVQAGAQLADMALFPSIRLMMPQLTPDQRCHVYAGLLGAMLGRMTSELGPDDAEELFHGFDGAFDEARCVRAANLRKAN